MVTDQQQDYHQRQCGFLANGILLSQNGTLDETKEVAIPWLPGARAGLLAMMSALYGVRL